LTKRHTRFNLRCCPQTDLFLETGKKSPVHFLFFIFICSLHWCMSSSEVHACSLKLQNPARETIRGKNVPSRKGKRKHLRRARRDNNKKKTRCWLCPFVWTQEKKKREMGRRFGTASEFALSLPSFSLFTKETTKKKG